MTDLVIANYIPALEIRQAPLSVVQMMNQMNLQTPNSETQVLNSTYDTFITDPAITDPIETTIEKPVSMVYINNIDPTINGVFGSSDMTSLPVVTGMPGLEATTATVAENYEQFEERMSVAAEVKFYDETVPMIATIGAAGAIALYFMMKSNPKKRRS